MRISDWSSDVCSSDLLPKPTDADQVEAALLERGEILPPPPCNPMSADRVRWEHIQRVYEQCDRNVSETARRLRMHRDRKSVVAGQSVSGRVDLGGSRISKKKKNNRA